MTATIIKKFNVLDTDKQKTITFLTRRAGSGEKWRLPYGSSFYATPEEAEKVIRGDYEDHEILIIDLGPLPE